MIPLIQETVRQGTFLRLILSPPRTRVRKIDGYYQLTERREAQEFHKNLDKGELLEWLDTVQHKQGQLFTTEADYHLFYPNKVIRHPPSQVKGEAHNRVKKRRLAEAPKDKERQIEKFLHEVQACLHLFEGQKALRVADFGCGKAYLTFALYEYLKEHFELEIIGIDLKEEVIQECRERAEEKGYRGLSFVCGSIAEVALPPIDMAIALHACDTATDIALKRALELKAKVILAAPCCQREFYSHVDHPDLQPLLKHNVLRERFASLVTDAARGFWLESEGYSVRIVEFIDSRHTPKNILIRALYTGQKTGLKKISALFYRQDYGSKTQRQGGPRHGRLEGYRRCDC